MIVDDINITKTRNLKNYYLKKVGFLFQNFALVEHKTVKENLEFIMKNSRTDITISEALSKVGMEGTEEQKVFSLSGGEQQRIALARLILKQCDLILADEPTGSLDRKNAEQVLRILKSFINNGKTVIMVTHDPSIIDDSMVKYELKKHLVN
ncbi:MAG TPA: ATP-binding cassette domain-containing protein [Ruminococcus sp.]|nr:ATP-binding cassette domain-containing protein [Ruminococcus sp.]